MMLSARSLRLCFVLLIAAIGSARAAEQAEVSIATGEGRTHVFAVEVVSTPQEMAMGLMFRTELAPDAGMLFLYPTPRETSFWMQNTYLPLDMLFIDEDGVIRHIAERTIPRSTTPIPSNGPVSAVLEINGGTSDRLGIAIGDRVSWPAITD
jgi:uncharacterized protein